MQTLENKMLNAILNTEKSIWKASKECAVVALQEQRLLLAKLLLVSGGIRVMHGGDNDALTIDEMQAILTEQIESLTFSQPNPTKQ